MLPLVIALATCRQKPQPVLDAGEVLRRLKSDAAGKATHADEQALLQKVLTFVDDAPVAQPDETAQQWVGIAKEVGVVSAAHRDDRSESVANLETLFDALPPPESWADAASRVDQTQTLPNKSLIRLALARIQGNDLLEVQICDAIEAKNQNGYDPVSSIRCSSLKRLRDFDGLIAFSKSKMSGQDYDDPSLEHYIELLPPEEASKALLSILQVASHDIYFRSKGFQDMAKKVMLQNLNSIKRPQWFLAGGDEDFDYVSKLVDRFGLSSLTQANNGQSAGDIYFFGLLSRGAIDKAVAYLKKSPYPPQAFAYRTDPWLYPLASKLYPAVLQVQKKVPQCDLSRVILTLTALSGHSQEMMRSTEKRLSNPKISPKDKSDLLETLICLHAFNGDLVGLQADEKLMWSFADPSKDGSLYSFESLLGALQNPQLLASEARHELKSHLDESLIAPLLATGQTQLAGQLVLDQLKKYKQTGSIESNGDDLGIDLCSVYYKTGQPKQILDFVKSYPYWDDRDLLSIPHPYTDHVTRPLSFYVAWALSKTGQSSLAEKILERTAFEREGADDCLALLNSLEGVRALPLYENLQKARPMDCHLLTWKSSLLLQLGRLQEAEDTVREAIVDDPSDMSTSDGNRQLAYHVLADILRQKGDLTGARSYENRFLAAGKTRRATELMEAGLLPQAAEQFRQSIATSPTDWLAEDNYGLCLDKQGRFEDADAHFRRAYELLPQGVGRIRLSMRFAMFDAMFERSGLVAGAPVLEKMGDSPTSTAQELFLRGRYEEAMGHPIPAVDFYQKAVQLDPKMQCAWANLRDLGIDGFLTTADTEAAEWTYMDLAGNLDTSGLDAFADLAPAYRQIVAARKAISIPVKPDFFLQVSSSIPPDVHVPWTRFAPNPSDPVGAFLCWDPSLAEIIHTPPMLDLDSPNTGP